jgi:hypothetical protein
VHFINALTIFNSEKLRAALRQPANQLKFGIGNYLESYDGEPNYDLDQYDFVKQVNNFIINITYSFSVMQSNVICILTV